MNSAVRNLVILRIALERSKENENDYMARSPTILNGPKLYKALLLPFNTKQNAVLLPKELLCESLDTERPF